MSRYAATTNVAVEKSKAEIEKLLIKYGADQFYSGWDEQANLAVVAFRIESRHVKMLLPLPDRNDAEFTQGVDRYSHRPTTRSPADALAAWEQSCRQRWRALVLIVRAKLEAVESGISTIEREFLPDIVLPNNQTVWQWAKPQLRAIYDTGQMPPLLPGIAGALEE